MLIRSLTDRLKKHWNVSVADSSPDQRWQSVILAVAGVGSDPAQVERTLAGIRLEIDRTEAEANLLDFDFAYLPPLDANRA